MSRMFGDRLKSQRMQAAISKAFPSVSSCSCKLPALGHALSCCFSTSHSQHSASQSSALGEQKRKGSWQMFAAGASDPCLCRGTQFQPNNPLCCLKLYPFPQSIAGLYISRPFPYLGHIFHQVMDCSMPLIGDHQVEDRQLITDLVISRMNQLLSRTPALSPQRPLTTQQPQVRNRKDTQCSHEPLLQTLWLKKKQRSDTYRPS